MEEHEEKWSNWIVPKEYCWSIIFFCSICVLVVLPLISGLRYTFYGFILNVLWADLMFFIWYKRRKIKEKELAQKRRRDKYFKDNE